MKRALSLALLLLAASSIAEVVLRDPGNRTSLIYDRTTSEGSIVLSETWSEPGKSWIVKSTFTDAGALAERMISVTRGRSSSRYDATVTPAAATVTSTARNGTGPPSTIKIGKRTTIVDPSVRWFVTDHPEKGASAAFMSFDPQYRYWEEITVTFEGRGKLGDSPEGNLVTRQTARSTIHLLLDDKGMPLVWEEGRLRLVRETDKK